MGIRDTIKNFGKRQSTTTYPNTGIVFDTFSRASPNPFNNESTWLEMYNKEPFIKGAVDAIVKAAIGEWSLETAKEKASNIDKKAIEKINILFTDPVMMFKTKLRTIAYKLLIDSVVFLETPEGDGTFFVLNKEDCTIGWDSRFTRIERVIWKKKDTNIKEEILEKGSFVIGSMFDPDTKLWQSSPMETIVDIANLLYHARNYNLDIFRNGGVPSMLYTLPEGTVEEERLGFKRTIKKLKSGENIVAIGEVNAEPIAGFTKDMEYNVLVDHGVQSIMTLYGVSPLMMNLAVKQGSGGGGEGSRQTMNAFATTVHTIQDILNDSITHAIHNLFAEEEDNEETSRGRPKMDPYRMMRFKLRKWSDSRQLSAVHKIYKDIGVLNPNEIRGDLGREPRKGGDEYAETNDRGAAGNTGGENPSGQDRDPNAEDDFTGNPEGDNANDGNRVEDK